ncbi:cytochrome b561 domain-containing protein [Ruegeria marina]|uniref:Cytochrome b561 domain-containing protein n=1 Tax=Ruegeria marina TaxID=639004 RepID=A0A1G6I222_9RHOB|nr:cytochrome b561 domain-containing protein [Ruegeria marina]SDC00599.1 hypothetical protein SAMN04488239_1016 [Ruegeria marina]
MQSDIPTHGYLPIVDITIPIHWDNHALLMFGIWFLLVPVAVLFLRFGKIPPTTYGIPRGTPKWAWPELCWTVHKKLLYVAMFLAVGGTGFAMLLSGGFSGSLHAWFGVGTLILGVLQVVSSWFRGSHGGRKDPQADPDNRATWGGNHFNMTAQRWWFEAYHKTGGYFALFLAVGAVATGLSQFWMPGIAISLGAIVFAGLVLAVVLQGRGHHHDTCQSVYGSHPNHPFNKRRFRRMLTEQDERP